MLIVTMVTFHLIIIIRAMLLSQQDLRIDIMARGRTIIAITIIIIIIIVRIVRIIIITITNEALKIRRMVV